MAHLLLQEEVNNDTTTTPRDGGNWVEVQHVTFTQWVNVQLRKHNRKVDDLTSAFTNGVNLCYLLDQLKSKVKKKNQQQSSTTAETSTLASKVNLKPKIPIQMIENINLALKSMSESGINLTGITSEEINKGNLKICLALVWRMILFYQINSDNQSSDETESATSNNNSKGKVSVEKAILTWIQDIISEYTEKYGFSVNDISSSWSDGKALGALIDRLMKEKYRNNLDEMFPHFNYERDVIHTEKSNSEINEHLVSVANDQLEIPNLIDSKILEKGPEKLSMLTYLSYFKEKGEEFIVPVTLEESNNTLSSASISPKSSPMSQCTSPTSLEEPPIMLTSDSTSLDHKTSPTTPTTATNSDELHNLRDRLELKTIECSKLENDINEKNLQIEAIESSLKEMMESSKQLCICEEKQKVMQLELLKFQEALSEAENQLNHEKEATQQMREREQDLKNTLENLESELNCSNSIVNDLKREIERLNSVELELNENLETASSLKDIANLKELDNEQLVSSLQMQLENLKENQEKVVNDLENAQLEKQSLQEQLDQLKQDEKSAAEHHTESLNKLEDELKESKLNLEQNLKNYENEKAQVERLNSSNMDLTVQIENITKEMQNANNKIIELSEQNQNLQTEILQSKDSTTSHSDSLQEVINGLEQDLKNQRIEKEELESKIANLNNDHEKSLSELREERQELETKLQQQVEKEQSHSKQIEKENFTLTQQVETLQQELANQKLLNESLTKSEQSKIQELSTSSAKQTESLKEELTTEKHQSQQLLQSLENEKTQNKNLKTQVEKFSEQLNSLKQIQEQEQKEKESLKYDFEKAIEKINSYEEQLKNIIKEKETEQVDTTTVEILESDPHYQQAMATDLEEEVEKIIDPIPTREQQSVTSMVYYFFAVLGVSFLLELSK